MEADGASKKEGGTAAAETVSQIHGTLEMIRIREESLADKSLQLIQTTDLGQQGRSEDLSLQGKLGEIDLAEKFHDKACRLPRWTRRETLVLVEAKKVGEARIKKKKEERLKDEKSRDGSPKFRPANESKWIFISSYCKQRGVDREANQCRKRWGNLFGDYKRIREWQKKSGVESFWLMRNDAKKENKLPGSFDPEVFEALESFMGRKSGAMVPEAVFENGRPASEEGLFSDIEHPAQEEDVTPDGTRGAGSSTPDPDLFKAQSPTNSNGRKKRKRPFVESEQKKDQLVALLENNCKVMSEHIQVQIRNNELDRAQRKQQSDSLVRILGKLADSLEKISVKLQKPQGSF